MLPTIPAGFQRHVTYTYTYTVTGVSHYWDRREPGAIDFFIEEEDHCVRLVSARTLGQSSGQAGSPLHAAVGHLEHEDIVGLKLRIDALVEQHREWLDGMTREDERKEQQRLDLKQEYLDMHADLVAKAERIPVEQLHEGDLVIHAPVGNAKAGKRAWRVTNLDQPVPRGRDSRETYRAVTKVKVLRDFKLTETGVHGAQVRYYKPGSTVLAVRTLSS